MATYLLRQALLAVVLYSIGGFSMSTTARPAAPPVQDDDATSLRHLVQEQQMAWNHGDGGLWARHFTEDAAFINIRGERFTGKNAIAQLHTRILTGPFRSSTAAVQVTQLHPLTPNAILVETEYTVTHFVALPPGVQPSEPGKLQTRMTLLAHRSASQWQWTFAQNTAVLASPGPTSAPR